MKNHCSGLISIQTGIRYAKKEKKKNLVSNTVPTRPGIENSKQIEKNSKN